MTNEHQLYILKSKLNKLDRLLVSNIGLGSMNSKISIRMDQP